MRLISAGSLVRAQSGPFFISDLRVFNAPQHTISQPESADGDAGKHLSPVLNRQNNGCDSILGSMKDSILSATFSCTIFLNAAATFAGQWTEVPGGASTHPSASYGVAVVSADDIWAVGSWGGGNALIEHWDGTNWSVTEVQSQGPYLRGVAARSSRDVWAVGANVSQTFVEHWNGRQWVAVPSPNVATYNELDAVCVISHKDAWAVGYSIVPGPSAYILMHWDGTSWSLVEGPPADGSVLSSLKAFATDDVWAVGYKDFDYNQNTASTFTLHWDGTAWSEVPCPNGDGTYNSLLGVDGAAPNDVWAVGSSNLGGLAMHWDGAGWSVVPTPVGSSFYAVTAISSTNVIAVGGSVTAPSSARWDGRQWRVIPTPPVFNNEGLLLGISNRNGSVWAVGYQGFFSHRTSGYDLIFNWTR
jgi:hypothetical protein